MLNKSALGTAHMLPSTFRSTSALTFQRAWQTMWPSGTSTRSSSPRGRTRTCLMSLTMPTQRALLTQRSHLLMGRAPPRLRIGREDEDGQTIPVILFASYNYCESMHWRTVISWVVYEGWYSAVSYSVLLRTDLWMLWITIMTNPAPRWWRPGLRVQT